MDTAAKIVVMQAFLDGKPIEFVNKNSKDKIWILHDNPSWDWNTYLYRVKEDMELKAWNLRRSVPATVAIGNAHREWMRSIIDAVKNGDIT